jgi:glycosyltransferase involved in cell wall biosynthesis
MPNARKPRLLFLCSRPPYPPIGGDRLKNYYLIPELAKTFDLTLICTGSEPLPPEGLAYLSQYSQVHFWQKTRSDFIKNSLLSPFRFPAPIQTSLYYFRDVAQQVCQLAKSHDAIFCNIIRTAPYAEDLNLPKFCDIGDNNGVYYQQLLQNSKLSLMSLYCLVDQPLIENYERHIISTFDQSFLFNEDELEEYNFPSKLTLIPHGVNPKLFVSRQPDHDFQNHLVFLGKMDTVPNIDAVEWFVANVMPLLPEHIRFSIIGANPVERVIALQSSRVHVLGFVDDPYPALKGALAVVAPMQLGRGIQNKVLEAMAIGALCIVSSAPSKAFKGVENRKHLLIADEPHEYADLVSEIASDRSAFEDVRSAGRQFIVENHSWERAGSIYTRAVQAGLKSTPQVAPTIKSAG